MATFNVTNLNDSGSGSLRQAILDANASVGDDLITFDSLLSGQTITLFTDELTITDDLTIDGDLDNNGIADITIQRDANAPAFRIFNVDDGDSNPDQTVILDGLAITGGMTAGSNGDGGGILNQENLTVVNSIVSGNTATGEGGGISNPTESSYLTVNNSTISGNSAAGSGGGIYGGFFSYLTVSNSTINGNSASGYYGGGGIAVYNSFLTVSDSTISNNNAIGTRGGGIYGGGSVSNSTISGNSAANGGGIHSRSLTVNDSTVSDNTGGGISTSNGGFVDVNNSTVNSNTGSGISADFRSNLTVNNSTISNNSAASGAGVRVSDSYLTVNNSTISDNSTTGPGGGIAISIDFGLRYFNGFVGAATVTNSTISNNSTTGDNSDGGGIYSYGADLTVGNSTISGNSTVGDSSDGGGIFVASSSRDGYIGSFGFLEASNSTITDNTAANGQGGGVAGDGGNASVEVVASIIAGNPGSDVDFVNGNVNTFASGGNNLIGNGNATAAFNQPTDIIGITDPGLEPLANNGGPTQTHALEADSLAIDAGSNPDGLATDQRGPGFDRVVNGQADIGAFETQTTANNTFFFSADGDSSVGNLTVADEDVVFFDGADFSLFFDGSDVLPSSAEISAFDVISDTEILLSFDSALTIEGVGFVDDSDVVKFTADSFGAGNTAGSFELYLDGSNLGLTRGSEDIDALTRMADGSLVFSTTGNAQLSNGLRSKDEDLISFNTLTGELSLYFDGSDVGLTAGGEDLDAVGIREEQLLFSTTGNFAVEGLSGRDEDAFTFTPSLLGGETSGSFGNELFFDGSEVGFTGDLSGIDFVG